MVVEIIDRQGHGINPELVERAARLAHEVGGGRLSSLSIVLLDDQGIAELNRRLLGRDGPTDVIAFEAEEDPEGLSAEIYVNVEAAARQGEEYGLGFEGELCFLVAHGVLHALGFSDADERERQEMFALQEQVLEMLGIKDGPRSSGRRE